MYNVKFNTHSIPLQALKMFTLNKMFTHSQYRFMFGALKL
jgi:hypothetical protein